MNRITTLFAGLLVAAGATTFVYAQSGEHQEGAHQEAEAGMTTVVGELIDTACYVSSDGGAKGEGHMDCAKKCMASGIPAGILPEGGKAGDMMFLLTNPMPLAEYAAKTIKVEGVVHEDMQSIDVKHAYVKQDDGSFKEIKLSDEHHGQAEGEEHDHEGHQH